MADIAMSSNAYDGHQHGALSAADAERIKLENEIRQIEIMLAEKLKLEAEIRQIEAIMAKRQTQRDAATAAKKTKKKKTKEKKNRQQTESTASPVANANGYDDSHLPLVVRQSRASFLAKQSMDSPNAQPVSHEPTPMASTQPTAEVNDAHGDDDLEKYFDPSDEHLPMVIRKSRAEARKARGEIPSSAPAPAHAPAVSTDASHLPLAAQQSRAATLAQQAMSSRSGQPISHQPRPHITPVEEDGASADEDDDLEKYFDPNDAHLPMVIRKSRAAARKARGEMPTSTPASQSTLSTKTSVNAEKPGTANKKPMASMASIAKEAARMGGRRKNKFIDELSDDEDDNRPPPGKTEWVKPKWTKAKLKSTQKGNVLKTAGNLAKPITHIQKKSQDDDEDQEKKTEFNAPKDAVKIVALPSRTKAHGHLKFTMNGAKIRDGANIADSISKPRKGNKHFEFVEEVDQEILRQTPKGLVVRRKGLNLEKPITKAPALKKKETINYTAVLKRSNDDDIEDGEQVDAATRVDKKAQNKKKQIGWQQPSWKARKLKSTEVGEIVKKGESLSKPITFAPQKEWKDYNLDANQAYLKETKIGEKLRTGGTLAKPITHIEKKTLNVNYEANPAFLKHRESKRRFGTGNSNNDNSEIHNNQNKDDVFDSSDDDSGDENQQKEMQEHHSAHPEELLEPLRQSEFQNNKIEEVPSQRQSLYEKELAELQRQSTVKSRKSSYEEIVISDDEVEEIEEIIEEYDEEEIIEDDGMEIIEEEEDEEIL